MIKAVIFDFDGTLSNRQRNAYDVFVELLKEYFPDLEGIEYEAVVQDMCTDDVNGTIPAKTRTIPFVNKYPHLPADFSDRFPKDYYATIGSKANLKPETIPTVEALKGKVKMAILTNGDSSSQHAKLDKVGIAPYMDEIVVSGDYGIHKPDPAIFTLIAEKLGVKNEECIFVGDVFSTDILGSFRAGMTPIWLLSDDDHPSDYPVIRIKKLDEIIKIIEDLNSRQ